VREQQLKRKEEEEERIRRGKSSKKKGKANGAVTPSGSTVGSLSPAAPISIASTPGRSKASKSNRGAARVATMARSKLPMAVNAEEGGLSSANQSPDNTQSSSLAQFEDPSTK
jgi:hypothetical protein